MRREESAIQTEALLDALDEGFDRAAWHGPNLTSALRGVTFKQAAWRPAPARHNIWELVVHLAYWKYRVRQRLVNGKPGEFPERGTNWFARSTGLTEKLWRRDLALLKEQHRLLRETVRGLGPPRLRMIFKGRRLADHVRGIAFHDIYHAGQIQLLKKLHG
jgi:DinB family protein